MYACCTPAAANSSPLPCFAPRSIFCEAAHQVRRDATITREPALGVFNGWRITPLERGAVRHKASVYVCVCVVSAALPFKSRYVVGPPLLQSRRQVRETASAWRLFDRDSGHECVRLA